MKFKASNLATIFVVVVICFIVEHVFLVFYPRSNSKDFRESITFDKERFDSQTISLHTSVINETVSTIINSTLSGQLLKLPAFSFDETEYLFGSLIEREANSYNLYLTTFFLSHTQLNKGSYALETKKVHPVVKSKWMRAMDKFRAIKYYPSGKRHTVPRFFCRIHPTIYSTGYLVEGDFIPNSLAADANANKLLDVFRCPINDPRKMHDMFAQSDEAMYVEILREDTTIASFSVPWKSRKSGYLLTTPTGGALIDAWEGYSTPSTPLAKIHICVPGTRRHLPKEALGGYLEFLSHHLLLGAAHVYLALPVASTSLKMTDALNILRSYIQEGSLSIVSAAEDGEDFVPSSGGMFWTPLLTKLIHANMCLYQAKGVAEYVAMVDVDMFIIPKSPHSTLHDIFNAVESPVELEPFPPHVNLEPTAQDWKPAPGWADGQAHPFCHLLLSSVPVFFGSVDSMSVENREPWIGNLAKNWYMDIESVKRQFVPTRLVFQAGLLAPGACMLSNAWNGCVNSSSGKSEFCGDYTLPVSREGVRRDLYPPSGFRNTHSFYESVRDTDAKAVNKFSEAVIYHFRYFAIEPALKPNISTYPNEYTSRFFPAVFADIQKRNLDILLHVFKTENRVDLPAPRLRVKEWPELFEGVEEKLLPISHCEEQKLPPTFSNITTSNLVKLPHVASDYSDYAIASMIERVANSFDLYVSTFFLCHHTVKPRQKHEATYTKVHPDSFEFWRNILNRFSATVTHYHSSGERKQPPTVQCRIRHADGYAPYVVGGRFVPNDLTVDYNANRRIDVFRCKMENTQEAYMTLAGTDAVMTLEILKDGVPVLMFQIPWKSRMTGLMLEPVLGHNSNFNPWKGFDASTPGVWKHDHVHMCVPGLELIPSMFNLPPLVEFIQHHLLLGVSHIFMTVSLGAQSPKMLTLIGVLKPFIDAGQVTMVSSSYDGYDMIYSVDGMKWYRDLSKCFHVNMCTYFSMGVADYVGIWDFDEFLIPRGENKNMIDVIRSGESPQPLSPAFLKNLGSNELEVQQFWEGGKGLADRDGHPYCALMLNSLVQRNPSGSLMYEISRPFVGHRFTHPPRRFREGNAYKKSFRSTRTVFMAGLHLIGACKLEPQWTPCGSSLCPDEMCWGEGDEYGVKSRKDLATGSNFHLNHRFDEQTSEEDYRYLDYEREAVIYHIMQINRRYDSLEFNTSRDDNEYVTNHFPTVFRALEDRGFVFILTLPLQVEMTKFEVASRPDWTSAAFSESVFLMNKTETTTPGLETQLPFFDSDSTSLVIGAVIERSGNEAKYLTTILFNPSKGSTMSNQSYVSYLNTRSLSDWKKFFDFHGRGETEKYRCRLQHDPVSTPYEVWGTATSLTDAGVPVTILRCPLAPGSSIPYEHELLADIYRGPGIIPFVSFSVPWKTRVNSKLWRPHVNSSSLNPWLPMSHSSVVEVIIGASKPPSKINIVFYIEQVQHSLNLGAKHVVLIADFSFESLHMTRLLSALRSFIHEGFVTVLSSCWEESTDFETSWAGAIWSATQYKLIQQVFSTVFLRGVADYVVTLALEDFFTPATKSDSIFDSVDKAFRSVDTADKSDCVLELPRNFVLSKSVQTKSSWLEENFGHGPVSSMSYIEASRLSGAVEMYRLGQVDSAVFTSAERCVAGHFDSSMFASVYHFSTQNTVFDPSDLSTQNPYALHYSNQTVEALRKRYLGPLVELPMRGDMSCYADTTWIDYNTFYEYRNSGLMKT